MCARTESHSFKLRPPLWHFMFGEATKGIVCPQT